MNTSDNDFKDPNKLNDFIKLAFWLYLAYFTFCIVTKKLETINAFIHNIDLPIHEFGHVFFSFISFGNSTIMSAGGNLFQFIFPCILTGVFFFSTKDKDFFGGFVCLIWAGETLVDASYYISDATTRDLPLITGDPDTHDWFNVLSQLNILSWDTTIGKIVFTLGSLTMIIGLIMSLYSLNKTAKFIEVK
ncbi:MAG: hypothetical protein H7263_16730 [Candidatus Sericytochromatia bacterium]|nr:hypothetical protein [Candidatus Sericytochromatia bacterium]